MTRWWIAGGMLTLAALAALGGLIYWNVSRRAAKTGQPPPEKAAVAVLVQELRRGVIRDTAHFDGALEAPSKFEISPKAEGRLLSLAVDVGDPIRRGDIIARLDDDEYRQAVDAAEAAMAVAEANVKLADAEFDVSKREFERTDELYHGGVSTQQAYDRAEATYKMNAAKCDVARAQVAQARSTLATAKTRLGYTLVKAEWDGEGDVRYMGERRAEPGDLLRAYDPIGTVIDLATVKAVVHVAETNYAKIAIGAPVTFTVDAYPGETFRGEVSRVPPLLQDASRMARVEVTAPNPDGRLKPGMFARATMEVARKDDALIAPEEALAKRENQAGGQARTGVYRLVEEDGQKVAVFVPVEIGLQEEGGGIRRVEILSPADLSGPVVTFGTYLLGERTVVAPMRPSDMGLAHAVRNAARTEGAAQ